MKNKQGENMDTDEFTTVRQYMDSKGYVDENGAITTESGGKYDLTITDGSDIMRDAAFQIVGGLNKNREPDKKYKARVRLCREAFDVLDGHGNVSEQLCQELSSRNNIGFDNSSEPYFSSDVSPAGLDSLVTVVRDYDKFINHEEIVGLEAEISGTLDDLVGHVGKRVGEILDG
jgi:hypothetical protein